MENGGSIPHKQRLFNNPYPRAESIQFLVLTSISLRSILILSSHLRVGAPRGLFPVTLPLKILKALIPFSILATCPAHLKLLDFSLRLYWVNDTEYEVPYYEAFYIPHSHPFWAQIFASGSCFQISLACVLLLLQEIIFHSLILHNKYKDISTLGARKNDTYFEG